MRQGSSTPLPPGRRHLNRIVGSDIRNSDVVDGIQLCCRPRAYPARPAHRAREAAARSDITSRTTRCDSPPPTTRSIASFKKTINQNSSIVTVGQLRYVDDEIAFRGRAAHVPGIVLSAFLLRINPSPYANAPKQVAHNASVERMPEQEKVSYPPR